LIALQVNEAITQLGSTRFFPGAASARKSTGNEVLTQVSALLQAYAPSFEQKLRRRTEQGTPLPLGRANKKSGTKAGNFLSIAMSNERDVLSQCRL
jgi:hypothetical protein